MNMWNTRYSRSEFVYGKTPNAFLKENVSHIPKGQVLCLAEGEGRNAVYLARLGYEVTAVDSSSVGLAKAKALAAECGVTIETQVADLEDYPVEPESWDAVVSIFCHVPKTVRKVLHTKVCSGLKRGGILLLEAYRPEQLAMGTGGPPEASYMMTLEVLREELTGLEGSMHGSWNAMWWRDPSIRAEAQWFSSSLERIDSG